jgi:hypothetical protein
MRKVVSIGMALMLVLGAEAGVVADSPGSVSGVARGSTAQPLPNARVQLRNTQTGSTVATTIADQTGTFVFPDVPPGDYIAEVVDASHRILGVSMPFSVASGQSASISILGAGSLAVGSSGFSLLGMGPVTSLTVLGAAAAASVTAVVATRPDASPSR